MNPEIRQIMAEVSKESESILSRRQFVELAGVSGVVALAGCTGGDGSGSNNSNNDGVYDAPHVSNTNQVPSNMQWNPANPTSLAQYSPYIMFDAFAKYNSARGEIVPYGISKWNFSGDKFELKIRDGLSWADGDKVTSTDIATQLRIGMEIGQAYASYTDSIETPDKRTVVMKFNSKVNQTIAEMQVLTANRIQMKETVFGKFLKQIKQNKQKGLRKLTKFAWQKPISSGPFAFSEANQQQLRLERRDDHPDSDKINFSEYLFRYLKGNQAIHQALINRRIDSASTVYTPPRIVKQFPDTIKQIQTPSAWGFGLIPNHARKHVGDRAVRQAIQYIIDRKQVVMNVSKASKMAPKYPVGIATKAQDRWLKGMKSFETYGKDSAKTKKAAQTLRNAGYSKQGGTWKDPKNDTVRLPLLVPSEWSDWVTASRTVVDQLNTFGFDAVLDSRSFGNLLGNIWPNGSFKLTAGGWLAGAPQGSYPYFSLHHQLIKNLRGFEYNYPPASKARGGTTADVTVPSRTGSGKMTTNPANRIAKLASSTKKSTIKDITVEQAWVTNQDLPMIPVTEKLEQTFIDDGEEWDIPPSDATVAQVRWANMWLPRQGKMKYTGGN